MSKLIAETQKNGLRSLAVMLAALVALTALPALAESPVVNVNSAEVAELALLPRVGPSVAARIVEHRDENGRFSAPEELMLVRGIGEKTYELIAPFVTLTGNTTLREKVSSSRASGEATASSER